MFDTEDITFAFDTVYIVRKNDPDVDLDPLRPRAEPAAWIYVEHAGMEDLDGRMLEVTQDPARRATTAYLLVEYAGVVRSAHARRVPGRTGRRPRG